MRNSKADKIPVKTKIVFDYLVQLEDFATPRGITDALKDKGITYNHVTSILHALKKFRAVDSMESDGKLWFYATPDTDTRTKRLEERTPELPGTRRHARKTAKP